MAAIAFGRYSKIYISASAFTAAGLIEVGRTQDIDFPDEAEDMTATARDLAYKVHSPGIKDCTLSFKRLMEATDAGTDIDLLLDAYEDGTELFVILTRAAKTEASGYAKKFKGKVLKKNEPRPEGGVAVYEFMIAPSDPSNLPTRVSTPLA